MNFNESMRQVLRVMAGDGWAEMGTMCELFNLVPDDAYFETLNDILMAEIEEHLRGD